MQRWCDASTLADFGWVAVLLQLGLYRVFEKYMEGDESPTLVPAPGMPPGMLARMLVTTSQAGCIIGKWVTCTVYHSLQTPFVVARCGFASETHQLSSWQTQYILGCFWYRSF